jgi:UDP-N-acetylmuramoyl-tripeptide--D-alanyl-D-alanine ligase
MLELGESSAELHREAGRFIAGQKIDLLVGVRGMAREIVAGAIEAGLAGDKALFCDAPEEAGELLANECKPGDVVLVKGSRGVRMEKAVEVLKRRLGPGQVEQKVT